MNRSKIKGTTWESAIVKHLRELGAAHVERRALAGAADRGDIAGLPGVVIEAKAENKINLAGWLAEAEAERVNDKADIGVVWAKRIGKTGAEHGYVIMTPASLVRLLVAAGYMPAVPQ
jgi:hypothetical protein